jgi:hypothetical protein
VVYETLYDLANRAVVKTTDVQKGAAPVDYDGISFLTTFSS